MVTFPRTAITLCTLLSLLLCQYASAGDLWNWNEAWEPSEESTADDTQFFPQLPDSVFELPHAVLSLQTHGNYFGSGDEFLLGGAQVYGIGGTRHVGDHSLNLPASALFPAVARMIGSSEYAGPLWGAPLRVTDPEEAGDYRGDEQDDPKKGSKSSIRWLRYDEQD